MSVPAQLERYFCIWAGLGGDERTLGKAHPWTTCKNCTRQVADDYQQQDEHCAKAIINHHGENEDAAQKITKKKNVHAQSPSLTLCDPMHCSLPSSSVHGISQARILKWAAISSSGNLPDLKIRAGSPASPALAGTFFITKLPGKHQEEK